MANPAFHTLRVVAICALLGAGCTQPLSVENRGCPCTSGYTCCVSNNLCLPEGSACEMVRVVPERAVVRQGDVVRLTVTGNDLVDVGDVTLGELSMGAMIRPNQNGFLFSATVPHGTAPGAKLLRFTTHGGRISRDSGIPAVTVSPITVSMAGDDSGDGTSDRPFRTFAEAIKSAGTGDTIHLEPGMYGDSGNDFIRSYLPNKVTLEGTITATDSTLLSGELLLSGDAAIRNVAIASPVTVNGAHALVTLDRVSMAGPRIGLNVAGFAKESTVIIRGKSNLSGEGNPTVRWMADDGTLWVNGGSLIGNMDDKNGEAIRAEGNNLLLEIEDSTITTRGENAVTSFRQARLLIQNSSFQGIVNLMGPDTTAFVAHSTFLMSSDTKAIGGIYFFGDHLEISDSKFHVVGLYQNNDTSTVTVRRSTFGEYVQPPVLLEKGTLDLGTKEEAGSNQFDPGAFVTSAPPVALRVEAEAGKASASMSDTTVGGLRPPVGEVMGPAKAAPYYQIEQMVPIRFY